MCHLTIPRQIRGPSNTVFNDGISRMPYIPNLAGQKDFYLVQSLMAYKTGERKSQNMKDAVKGLSDEDLANLAACFAAIKITVKVPK